ncbi:sugar transferase [Pelagibacterium luteolum]|uniref:Sugar transferase involved in LPS biosynthesis (Colanic, teichoic acid) n=1 Tax=Pelagibacterium luteolum TaxID=440168 RepID=A0A1G7RUZ6_9HYPH|nr:sugar transferase [Pelagibacterium luteolum]SDG14504.1 Sugar transferase involved in LPS biosynthesis (colanic, teichoic acid) [Pelagibacterium luteolum]
MVDFLGHDTGEQTLASALLRALNPSLVPRPIGTDNLERTLHSGLVLKRRAGAPLVPARVPGLAKRSLDIGLALWLLATLWPLMLLAGLAVKLSGPGPILFTQIRAGQNGRPFTIYKFRSMRTEAAHQESVTAVGAVLRRTSFDELPQIFNVLRGEMSMVGPRPHVIDMHVAGQRYDDLVPHYAQRLTIRPGISGWAQVNGLRGVVADTDSAQARIDHDLAYLQNISLTLDIKIVWLTVTREILRGTGR